MKRLCVMFLALCGLALPLAAADAPETPPFSEIHSTYLERDVATHTRLLRGALREARRLLPEACAQRQRDLINVARFLGFDGLESLWLIYQDCAAQGTGPELRARRLDNARLLQETLHYAAPPAPQLALRVSHWNSVLERGVRGDAVRTVLQGFVAADPVKAQGWNLRNLLRTAQVSSALCALAPRQNQFGKKALAELLRHGQCVTGAVGPSEICAELMKRSGGDGTVTIPGASEEENKWLSDLCTASPPIVRSERSRFRSA
ncbi:MAG TPA: hypothetical protein VE078_02035 [Thermoanaerobaculia bacterium]|nr:hypothetical protein [Thermoanaerobaculia bacterium]